MNELLINILSYIIDRISQGFGGDKLVFYDIFNITIKIYLIILSPLS